MPHALLRVWPGVDHDPVPSLGQTFRFGHARSQLKEAPKRCPVNTLSGIEPRYMLARYDQNMNRCLRLDIPEGERIVAAIHDVRGQLAGHDPAKEAVDHASV